MLKIAGDTHTHTIACQHAFSTIQENVTQAGRLGHRFIALTDHGPAMEGCVHHWYFSNLPRFVPQELDGLVLLRGCEANVLAGGSLDLDSSILGNLDWVIASMHRGETLMPVGLAPEIYTEAWLNIARNPYVDCIGHMGHTAFFCDYETVIEELARQGKVVEINSSSYLSRPGSEPNCREIIRLCKKHGVKLVLSSDAHFYTGIGQVDWSVQAVEAEDFPASDILNLDYSRMRRWLMDKKGLSLPE